MPDGSQEFDMSIKVMSQVWQGYPGDSSPELLILLALADWCDDEGRCFPSIAAIGRKCRIGTRQAQRHVHRMIDVGMVAVTENVHGGKPGSTRRYRINLDSLTGVANVTGVKNVTGVVSDAEGCHGRRETGVVDDTLTIIDTSITVKKVSSRKKSEITLKQFLDACKENSEQAIPETDPVFEYAETVGLDAEMIAVCWKEFKAAYLPTQKTYKDWRATFRKCVRGNWYKLWFMREGEQAAWTSVGEQARRAAA